MGLSQWVTVLILHSTVPGSFVPVSPILALPLIPGQASICAEGDMVISGHRSCQSESDPPVSASPRGAKLDAAKLDAQGQAPELTFLIHFWICPDSLPGCFMPDGRPGRAFHLGKHASLVCPGYLRVTHVKATFVMPSLTSLDFVGEECGCPIPRFHTSGSPASPRNTPQPPLC